MGLMDKIFNRKDDIDPNHDPFANNKEQGGDPFAGQNGQDQFAGQGGSGDDPFQSPQGQDNFNNPSAAGRPGFDTNNPDMNSQLGIPKPDPYKHNERFEHSQDGPLQQGQSSSSVHIEKDLQIIIAKLDALKSELDSLHQRVQKIERIADADQQAQAAKQQAQQRYQW